MDMIFGFLFGVLASPWFFGIFILAACWCSDFDSPFLKFVLSVLAMVSAVFVLELKVSTFTTVVWGALLFTYLTVGLFNSIYRYKKYINSYKNGNFSKKEILEICSPSKNYGKITTWVICWPTSAIFNLFDDVFEAISGFLKKYFGKMYNSILESSVASMNLDKNDKKKE